MICSKKIFKAHKSSPPPHTPAPSTMGDRARATTSLPPERFWQYPSLQHTWQYTSLRHTPLQHTSLGIDNIPLYNMPLSWASFQIPLSLASFCSVCWRMLTYADVCCRKQYVDDYCLQHNRDAQALAPKKGSSQGASTIRDYEVGHQRWCSATLLQ